MFGKLGVEGIMEKRNVEGNFVFCLWSRIHQDYINLKAPKAIQSQKVLDYMVQHGSQ